MAFCRECGAAIGEGAKFCEKCGANTGFVDERKIARPKEKHIWVAIVIAVVVIAVLVIVGLMVAWLDSNGGGGLYEPQYSGVLELTIFNDDWLDSKSYTVYVDGDYMASGTIDALSTAHRNINVEWTGGSTHQLNIEVYAEGSRHLATTWITNGMTASTAITI